MISKAVIIVVTIVGAFALDALGFISERFDRNLIATAQISGFVLGGWLAVKACKRIVLGKVNKPERIEIK